MKKLFLSITVAAAALFAGCQKKEIAGGDNTANGGSTFELVAEIAQTKTTLDADTYKVDWESDDVIYMVTSGNDTPWKTAQEFTYADGKFTSESSIVAGTYTMNALYCTAASNQAQYHKNTGTTHKLASTQAQDSKNPTLHIKENDALVGSFETTIPMEGPAKVNMSHLYTLMHVDVVNNTGTAINVTKFEMTVPGADLAGIFTIDFANSSVNFKQGGSETITVEINNGTVAAGATLPVYFVAAPFKSNVDDGIVFKVTTDAGVTYSEISNKAIEFEAGKYNTTSYAISTADSAPEVVTVAEFKAKEDDEVKVYELKGRISKIYEAYNATYNNIAFYLKDATGEVLIYRMSCDDITDPAKTITVGDEITVQGKKTTYNNAAQMPKGCICVSHRDGCLTPVITVAENLVTIEAGAGEAIYYTINGNVPTTASTPYNQPFEITETVTVKAIAVADSKLQSLVAEEECEYINLATTATATLTFDDTAKRTVGTTTQQVWVENGITFTNDKASSTSNVNTNYYKPVRLYKGSSATVAKSGMIKIVFECNNATYAEALKQSITDARVDVQLNDDKVTVEFDSAVDTYSIAAMSAQVRLDAVTVTYSTEGGSDTPELQNRNLAFSATTATATVGQSFTAPTLSGITDGVTFTSSNVSVATVNESTGVVTIVAAGETVITASAPANGTYAAGTASYTLNVSAASTDDGDETSKTETLEIFANKGTLSGKSISWTGEYFTCTNNQAGSSNAIRTSDADHFRVYASSELKFTSNSDMTFKTIVVTCTTADYATALVTSATNAGYSATANGVVVTISEINSKEVTIIASQQTRIKKVEATLN